MDYTQLKGFNYQPSWGSTGYEIWRNFDGERMGHELALGKAYFPGMNAIRLWLSHDAWLRNPGQFAAAFDAALGIADRYGVSVMPVLFNRWHCAILDYGGIYIDHFLPQASWVQGKDAYEKTLDDYVSFAGSAGKPLIATETCWGATDDGKRVEIIRYTLAQLKKRKIGWLVYLLHHSLIADAHRPEFGPLSSPGNLAFIEADGRLRPGHGVFNED